MAAALVEHYGTLQAAITRVLRALVAEDLVHPVPRWGRCQAARSRR